MKNPPFDEKTAHRWFAVKLNNLTWDLLETEDRTDEQTEEMVSAAHAALYHWYQIGTAANHARGECLLTYVHAEIGEGTAALQHAQKCLKLTESNPDLMSDWDFAFANDCLSVANALEGNKEEASRLKMKAEELGNKITDPEDKKIFKQWFHRKFSS
ncbi:MAG: hypothetical protein ACE5EE_08060 [Fidelibacterota bacterium]